MDEKTKIKKESKWDRVGCFSKLFSTWIVSIFYKGLKRQVEFDDLYKCSKYDEANLLAGKLEKYWNIELKKKKPSFLIANIKCFGLYYFYPVILFGFEEAVLHIIQPILLGNVISYFANPKPEHFLWACLCAAGVCAASAVFIIIHHPTSLFVLKLAMQGRVAWCTLMYKKALRLSHSGLSKTTIGQILNLMSNDVSRFDEFWIFSGYFIASPVQAVIGIWVCWWYIKSTVLIGAGLLFLCIPFQGFMGRMFFKIRTKVASISDNRIRLMNEIIKGMRVIKMYAWENHFSKIISSIRKSEVIKIRFASYLRAFNIALSITISRIILFCCFVTYVLVFPTERLSAEQVFVVMTIFNTLRHTMTWMFPQSVGIGSELYVSCLRVQKFLLLDELEPKNEHFAVNESNPSKGIIVKNLTARWDNNNSQPTLDKVSVEVKPGELLAVVGPVGAGKTSFLMSCLNEIPITGGNTAVNGRVAYAAQESWSFNSSVKQNILFGRPELRQRYEEVIKVCALKRDLKLFPFGDKTLVGERGVSLSGGQKARITLARALYNDADIYLLDDPLSAVDAEVAKHIFEKCIIDFLKSKTVILVTHQLQFIKKATRILVLKDGKVLALGSYDELLDSGLDFMSILKDQSKEKAKSEESLDKPILRKRTMSVLSNQSEISVNDMSDPQIEEEQKAAGSIRGKIYWDYARAGGGYILLFLTLITTLLSQAILHYNDIWLSEWTNKNKNVNNGTEEQVESERNHDIIIYSVIVASTFILMVLRSWTFFLVCTNASVTLHNSLFFRLLRAPMHIFDNNPVGRILNRFTRDLGIIDEQLPLCAYDLNLCATQAVGILIVVSLANVFLLIPAAFLVILVLKIRSSYIKTARDLKRYEGIARSPIYNQMTTTLNGLSTIRAFKAQELFKEQYYRYQNDHSATWFLCLGGSRLLGITMDWLCIVYIVLVTIMIMIFHKGLPDGTAGLALTMALGLTGLTQWGVRQSAEVENCMTNVERVLEYSRLPTEAELEIKDKKPPPDWPQQGHISFKQVSLIYSNSAKPVLDNLSFEIKSSEKIGVVGRTGAGKSSLLAALFRMTEPEGSIIIDGIDIKSIGLHDLRKKLSIIPQDPVAFIGSLRHNLDPFGVHTDDQIWNSLEQVQLKSAINELPEKLEFQVSEGGSNFSIGQRQLICLARAILRNNKILVLDEATANVDHKTDTLIQTTIRKNFASCTVITIAHRLNTIIDSDRVMVLDAGRIIEFDQPYNLLQKRDGLFFKLVNQTGPYMAAQLNKAAEEALSSRGLTMQ